MLRGSREKKELRKKQDAILTQVFPILTRWNPCFPGASPEMFTETFVGPKAKSKTYSKYLSKTNEVITIIFLKQSYHSFNTCCAFKNSNSFLGLSINLSEMKRQKLSGVATRFYGTQVPDFKWSKLRLVQTWNVVGLKETCVLAFLGQSLWPQNRLFSVLYFSALKDTVVAAMALEELSCGVCTCLGKSQQFLPHTCCYRQLPRCTDYRLRTLNVDSGVMAPQTENWVLHCNCRLSSLEELSTLTRRHGSLLPR